MDKEDPNGDSKSTISVLVMCAYTHCNVTQIVVLLFAAVGDRWMLMDVALVSTAALDICDAVSTTVS
jgi:hypothetical protein